MRLVLDDGAYLEHSVTSPTGKTFVALGPRRANFELEHPVILDMEFFHYRAPVTVICRFGSFQCIATRYSWRDADWVETLSLEAVSFPPEPVEKQESQGASP